MSTVTMFTSSDSSRAMWEPEEVLIMLDAVDAGNMAVFERQADKIQMYMSAVKEKLHNVGLSSADPIPDFIELLKQCRKNMYGFDGYLRYVKAAKEKGNSFASPRDWHNGIVSCI